jgi:thiamine monophosphate synthase
MTPDENENTRAARAAQGDVVHAGKHDALVELVRARFEAQGLTGLELG